MVKEYHNSLSTSKTKLLSGIPEGMPRIVPPEGLSQKRREYLFNEIREFCTEESKDLVCPEPPPRIGMFNLVTCIAHSNVVASHVQLTGPMH